MQKFLLSLFVFANITYYAFSQTGLITGKVVDAETSEPLELVNIYVNRTTIGTTSSMDGTFSLSVPVGNIEVIWSRVGYKTHKLTIPVSQLPGQPITVSLSVEQTSLAEVTVSAKEDKGWERRFDQFRKVFLGTDEIADKCIIVNKEVLDLIPSKEGSGFTATASEPLEVINPMLGYKIRYELVSFTYSRMSYRIAGNIQFENLQAESISVSEYWRQNRLRAYRNSVRSFLKSVIDNRIKEEGYQAFAENKYEKKFDRTSLFAYFRPWLTPIERSKFLRDTTNGDFIFHSRTRLEVHDTRGRHGTAYRDVRYPVSWIELSQPLHISRSGVVYNQNAIQLIGHLTAFRIAHLLPENYEPEEIPQPPSNRSPSLLTEQIYVHTDRQYYYPGDPVWLKGYMKYGDALNVDSMSRVVYVEVIDTTKRVISRKTFPIEYGTFDGQVTIPSSLEKTNLTLRVYTQWMRNFDGAIFQKALPVLDGYERAVENSRIAKPSDFTVIATASQSNYKFQDEIELTIHVTDASGDTIAADLSLAVTDYDVIKPIQPSTPITTAFKNSLKFISNTHKIEKGITLQGNFTNGNKKISEPVTITAVLGQLEDMTSLKTNADGSFFITGFYFHDSTSVGLQALNKKKRPFGEFTVVPHSYPAITKLPEFTSPAVNKVHTAMPKSISGEGDGGVLLKEVTVTAKREKPYKDLYSSSDISMSGDRIRELNPVDLMSIFRGRLPRIKVIWMMNDMGILQETLYIPGVGVPMVVIDGMQVTGTNAMQMVKALNVRTIESIDVMANATASIYGSRGANGVVVIKTITQNGTYFGGDKTKFSPRDFSVFPVHGFSTFKPFEQSLTNDSNASTVYWNPYVLLNAHATTKVSFKATVRSSKYLVSFEGFTRDGQAVSGSHVINLQE